jgi:acyl-CoA ligase (AMP-forming) (exosortase A-associated)
VTPDSHSETVTVTARASLHEIVLDAARRDPGATALVFKDRSLGYGELAAEIEGLASALAALGLEREDRVAVYLDKQVETVVAMFGAAAAGAAFVPVNPLLRPPQVAHILGDCGVRLLVTSAERLELLEEELGRCPSVEWVVVVGGGAGRAGEDGRPRSLGWEELVGMAGAAPGPSSGADLDMAAIFYTSGSTGKPKGVVLSHRNLIAGAESVASYLRNGPGDRILAVLPLSFDAGFSQLTTAFASGARLVLANYLLPRDVIRLCAEHEITGLTGVPPLWIQLAEQEWPPQATARMRYFANTGGRMPRATLDSLRAIFPAAEPFLMYGLTEAFRSTYLDPSEVDRRPDSIGRAIPNAEVLVVREDGSRCAPGEKGELVHRGPLVSLGYWNDPERTAERFRPPPFRAGEIVTPEIAVWSGDLVTEDEDGYLYFVGRDDEMIKTSGYRVSPAEVEEAVYETGLARDAVALGVEDEKLGQRIVLAVSPLAGADGLDTAELLVELGRRLPRYMLPKQVEVLADLPRSPNGKFDRTAIRSELTPE